jgi:hypothetical protein
MADVLEQFFGGAVAKQPPPPPAKPTGEPSVITDQLLDNLRRVESGGDRFALNKQSKAMGAYQFLPEQVITMHKKGIEFNPFNEAESRLAAKTYLEQLVKEKGSVEKALATYGGFITKDPTEYVNKVLKAPAAKANAPTTTNAAQSTAAPADPLEAFFSGKPATATPTATQPTVAQPSQPITEGVASTQEGTMGAYVPRRQPVNPVRQILGKVLQKGFEAKQALGQDLGERVAGGIDTLYGIIPATYGAGVQALARTAQTPEQAERTGQAAAATIDKPLGKALGITGKPTYQQPLGGLTEPIAEQVNKMFNVLGMTPEQISEKTGIPAPDIRNMVVIGSVALPQAVKEVAPVVKQVVKPLQQAAGELEIVQPGQLTKAEAQAQFEARQAPAGSVGAAATANNPFAGKITGEETARGEGVFPQVKLTKIPKDVPVSEQQLRSQLFQEVLPDLKPRPGVVTGNDNLLRNEHGLAAMAEPSPLGMKLKEQIANEQVGLSKFAEDRVNATGARSTFINDEQRGNFLNDVAYGKNPDDLASSSLTGYLNQVKQDTYKSAFKNAGNNKINTTNVDDLFVNPQEIATFKAAGTSQLLDAAKDLINEAKTAGFKLPNGEVAAPGSVAAYDRVRKIFNSPRVWTPEKAESIRTINQAIDRDIAAVADPAMYKLGDKIHQVEKTILGSIGFKRLFGEVDANGNVTSKVAPEKMLSTLTNLRKDEWRHIRDTFNELANGRVRGAPEGLPPVPLELRQSAAAAVAEMDGALAREVYKAGATKAGEWNPNSVNNVLNSIVGEKILETFPPSEVQKYHALNYVGQFTPGLKYEGAGQQTRRISLLEKNYPAFGATVGSGLGAVIGETPLSKEAALGGFIGKEVGTYLQTKKAAREEAKAVKKMEKEMEKAKALGKQTGQNKVKDLGK